MEIRNIIGKFPYYCNGDYTDKGYTYLVSSISNGSERFSTCRPISVSGQKSSPDRFRFCVPDSEYIKTSFGVENSII